MQLVALSPFKIVTLDTSNETSVLEAAQQLEGVPIDLLINNAGIAQVTTFATVTKESFVHQFLHCKSSVMGSISNNKEENAYMSRGQYGYTAPKAALNMVTRSLAMDLLERNISVVTANLGFVDTEMNNHQGIVNPADTAASMAEIVAKMSLEDSGKSFDADPTTPGSELPW